MLSARLSQRIDYSGAESTGGSAFSNSCESRPGVCLKSHRHTVSIFCITASRRWRSVSADVHAQVHHGWELLLTRWKISAHSNGCNSVYRSAGERRILDGQISSAAAQSASLRSAIRTPPACPPDAFDRNPETRRRSDMSDDAECDALGFQDRPLLNVQFHECLVIASRQLHCCEFASSQPRVELARAMLIAVSQLAAASASRFRKASGFPSIRCQSALVLPK